MPPSGLQLGLGLGLSTSTTPSPKLLDFTADIDPYITRLDAATTLSAGDEAFVRARLNTLFNTIAPSQFATLQIWMWPDLAANSLNVVSATEGLNYAAFTYNELRRSVKNTANSNLAANGPAVLSDWGKFNGLTAPELGGAGFAANDGHSGGPLFYDTTPAVRGYFTAASPRGLGYDADFGAPVDLNYAAYGTVNGYSGIALFEKNIAGAQTALEDFYWGLWEDLTGFSGRTGWVNTTGTKTVYAKKTSGLSSIQVGKQGESLTALTTSYQAVATLDDGDAEISLATYWQDADDTGVINASYRSLWQTDESNGYQIEAAVDNGETILTKLFPIASGFGDVYLDYTDL